MKRLCLILMPVLAGCSEARPCMGENEAGTVVSAQSDSQRVCGRYGCTDHPYTVVTLAMPNGTTRICRVSDVVSDMLKPGQKLNLPDAKRTL